MILYIFTFGKNTANIYICIVVVTIKPPNFVSENATKNASNYRVNFPENNVKNQEDSPCVHRVRRTKDVKNQFENSSLNDSQLDKSSNSAEYITLLGIVCASLS